MANEGESGRIGRCLYVIYVIMLAFSIVFYFRILYIQAFWKPDPEIEKLLTQRVVKESIYQNRGSLLSDDGRPWTISYPQYQICIDSYIIEGAMKGAKADTTRQRIESEWKAKVKKFSTGLAENMSEGKSASYYENLILKAYKNKSHYLELGKPIETAEYERLKTYPLMNESRNKGGVWAVKIPSQKYPYGALARRTLGKPADPEINSAPYGIEGKFNDVLKGSQGSYYIKKTDNGYALESDSLFVEAVNGKDIQTTLNVDYQQMADKALRKRMQDEPTIESGCCVLMDVKTGAIKAMANLTKGKDGLGEKNNVAVTWRIEPGSVFKIVTLMMVLEDSYVTSIDETIPGNGGVHPYFKKQVDKHITDYEREHHTHDIPLSYCVHVSSNYAFRYLAYKYYETNPKAFIQHLDDFQLSKPFDFDVYEKITTPAVSNPDSKSWSRTDLGQMAMGYSVSVTPMHLLMFYNAIANKGKMMKPYLVEGPTILKESICSAQNAGIITEALAGVTEKSGTAWRLAKAPCKVAGKTGTSKIVIDGRYETPDGYHKNQATFVGFFPAEDPQYSIIVSLSTELTKRDFYGGTIPVEVALEVINKLYRIDPYWNEDI